MLKFKERMRVNQVSKSRKALLCKDPCPLLCLDLLLLYSIWSVLGCLYLAQTVCAKAPWLEQTNWRCRYNSYSSCNYILFSLRDSGTQGVPKTESFPLLHLEVVWLEGGALDLSMRRDGYYQLCTSRQITQSFPSRVLVFSLG